ncbi:uncharacterized protein [Branchiostoma lanceolatum]|uniref:uncharacterized protein isoform X1 n=1 Tax=Branchiostoma lanceolatum TaxID=7740 RepID=UPI0034520B1D
MAVKSWVPSLGWRDVRFVLGEEIRRKVSKQLLCFDPDGAKLERVKVWSAGNYLTSPDVTDGGKYDRISGVFVPRERMRFGCLDSARTGDGELSVKGGEGNATEGDIRTAGKNRGYRTHVPDTTAESVRFRSWYSPRCHDNSISTYRPVSSGATYNAGLSEVTRTEV